MTTRGRIINLYTLDESGCSVRTACVVAAIDNDQKAIEAANPLLGQRTPDEQVSVGVVTAAQIAALKMESGEMRSFAVGLIPDQSK